MLAIRAPDLPALRRALAFQASGLPEASDPHYHAVGEVFAAILGDRSNMGRLLVSVRGPNEALAAAGGVAYIAGVEYPVSALDAPYALIRAVQQHLDETGFPDTPTSKKVAQEKAVYSKAVWLLVETPALSHHRSSFLGRDS